MGRQILTSDSGPPKDIEEANRKAVEKILAAQPTLVDIKPAIEVLPGMTKNIFLHSGPPIEWKRMCGPVRGALIGAIIYEGLAETPEKAVRLIETGEIEFAPHHHYNAVGGMAHVTSASMPLFVVEDTAHGHVAYCHMREVGVGKALRYGVHSDEVLQKLHWVKKTLGPGLEAAISVSGGIDLKSIMARAIQMGDDGHSRIIAGTSLFERTIMPHLLQTDLDKDTIMQIASHIAKDDLFALSLNMAAAKAIMQSAHGINGSTIVTVMARNGTDFGIWVSGLGEQWFTAPSPPVDGVYFPGYGPNDANPADMGDSSIIETMGLGAMVTAAAPSMAQLSKSKDPVAQAVSLTRDMFEITVTKNASFTIPYLGSAGVPAGIDIRKVVETGIVPIINTAIAHKQIGFGMIGVGLAKAPIECFKKALEAMVKKMGL